MLQCGERVVSHLHASASCSTPVATAAWQHRRAQQCRRSRHRILQRHRVYCKGTERESAASVAGVAQEAATVLVQAPTEWPTVTAPQIREELVKTRFIAETLLPTRHGKFRLRGYKHSLDGGTTFTEPTAIICGAVEGQSEVALRVHDACFTSEVLGSLKCDCAEQLALSLEYIQDAPPGMIIYLQQEGRGIGLANKIAAYSLQEQGLDTVDANRALGLPDDCREYTSVRNILRDLHIKSVRLMTNNPRKINVLQALGITVTGRIPCVVRPGELNQGYMDTKRSRMDHILDGSFCFWDHDGEPLQASAVAFSNGGMGLPEGYMKGTGIAPMTIEDSSSDEEDDDVAEAAGGNGSSGGGQQAQQGKQQQQQQQKKQAQQQEQQPKQQSKQQHGGFKGINIRKP